MNESSFGIIITISIPFIMILSLIFIPSCQVIYEDLQCYDSDPSSSLEGSLTCRAPAYYKECTTLFEDIYNISPERERICQSVSTGCKTSDGNIINRPIVDGYSVDATVHYPDGTTRKFGK